MTTLSPSFFEPSTSATASTMIEQVDPEADPAWDDRLRHWPQASLFHTSAWHCVLRETYGFAANSVIAREGTNVRAILPMMEVRSPFTGNRGISLPFTDHCEPLGNDDATFSALFEAAINRGIARKWKYLEFRGASRFFANQPPSVSYFGHTLALSEDPTQLFAQFDSSTRRAVRKAETGGLTIEFSRSLETVRDFYRLLCRTRQRHGVPPQPMRFFESIHRHVVAPGYGWVVLAKRGHVPVAAAIFFHSDSHAMYKYGASDDTFQQLRANNLVMWAALQWYARHGFKSLDFGRTSLRNAGLRRFKLGWGTTESHINYHKYDLRTRQFVISRDESSGWHNRVFSALPRSLSQLIGSFLYKHIA